MNQGDIEILLEFRFLLLSFYLCLVSISLSISLEKLREKHRKKMLHLQVTFCSKNGKCQMFCLLFAKSPQQTDMLSPYTMLSPP